MSLGSNWSNWIAEVRAKVGRDGTVRAMDKRYYCADLLRYIGWEVTVLLPVDEGAPAQVWSHQHYLCSPDLIQDVGFLDHEGALEIVAEYRAKRAARREEDETRRASVIRGQAEALLKLIDHRASKARDFRRILGVVEVETLTRAIKRIACGAGTFGVKPIEDAKQDRMVSADPGIEQIEAIFKHLHSVFGGHLHGAAPAADDGEPTSPADHGQRLCQGAVKSQPESDVGGDR